MQKHFENGQIVADYLFKHPKVEKVNYSGSPNHPRYHIMRKNATGCSGMIAFWLKDATLEQASKCLSSLKMFTLAVSLGGYKSLAEHPALMTHACVPEQERAEVGITDNLIRLSVGLEDSEDLIFDLGQAIEAAYTDDLHTLANCKITDEKLNNQKDSIKNRVAE